MRKVSKQQLLGFAIASAVVFVVFLIANVGCLTLTGLAGTVIFGLLYYNRYRRDQELVNNAPPSQETGIYAAIPKRTAQATPGSSYVGPVPPTE